MDDSFINQLASFSKDPLGYVQWAYPWGEAGTDLAKHDSPDLWQVEAFSHIRDQLARGERIIRIAIKSGHGVGKSALSSMLTDWAMSTFVGTKGVITANTERQLRTKTWVELGKWRRLSLTEPLFNMRATSLRARDPALEHEWRTDMSPWSEHNTEAFAGLHNAGKRILLLMDESSGIKDVVWEVAEGAMTDEDTEIIWIVLGNPTMLKGRFRECFSGGKFAHRWKQITVDSRTSRFTNKTLINSWIEDHGLDSDFVRVRVLGEFPKFDVSSFIQREAVTAALARELQPINLEPVVLGVDVARDGDDWSVIVPRQGRDIRSRPIERHHGLNTVQLSERVAQLFAEYGAAAIYVDETGIGGGVVDILRSRGLPVRGVIFSESPQGINTSFRGVKFANRRAEIWAAMKDWLVTGCLQNISIDKDYSLIDDITTTNYYHNIRDEIILEPKAEIKRREGHSPDVADAIAISLAFPALDAVQRPFISQPVVDPYYNPYANLRNRSH